MDKVQLAIVGCGGMGGRHLFGLQELYQSDMCNVELVAVCDLRRDNAEHLADNATELLGSRPQVFESMEAMVGALPELQAVDITTDTGTHHIVACQAFDLELNVLCEKPLGLTLRGCNLILGAHRRSGKLLSVAENYRRDPMSRLTKALLDQGLIGDPFLYLNISAGGGNGIIILPWRHYKHVGGILVDAGVHDADMMLYYLGDARDVSARLKLCEPVRYKANSASGVSGFYEHWRAEMPDEIIPTAEDCLVSSIAFDSGIIAQWTSFYAAHAGGFGGRVIYGSQGNLKPGGTRNGVTPVLALDGQEPISGDALLDLVPDFHLDPITANLFGAERIGSYEMPFPHADRKLLAIEYHELAECLLTGKEPEVTGEIGRRALALCYAAFESSVLGRRVTLDEIEAEETARYEADINAHWKLS